MRELIYRLFLCTALLFCVSNIHALTVTWDGDAGDGLWTSNTNWDSDAAPLVGDDIYIPAGANVTIPAGSNITVNYLRVGENNTGQSTLSLANSTSSLTVTTTLEIKTYDSPLTPTTSYIDMNGGDVTCEDLMMVGQKHPTLARSHDPYIYLDGGTLTINGDLTLATNHSAATAVIDMRSGEGHLKLDGTITTGMGNEKIDNISGGKGTIEYTKSGTQTVYTTVGAALTYHNLVLSGASAKTLENNVDINGDLAIKGTASLDVAAAGPYTINLAGSWTVTSTTGDPFVQRTGTVTFDGSGAKGLSTVLAGGETFYNLTMNTSSSANLTLSDDITIENNGTLTLTNGDILLGANDVIIEGASGDISGGSSLSHFVTASTGMVEDDYTATGTSETYPFGDGTTYFPITFELDAATLASANIRVSGTGDAHANKGSGANYASVYWTINPTGITGSINYDIIMVYGDADIEGDESDYIGWKYSGGGWTSGGTNDDGTNTCTWDDLTSFSDYTLMGTGQNPLPVVLTHFKAINQLNSVQLNWTTATEINSDYFTIERSADGIDFEAIGTVEANGFSSTTKHYSLSDEAPLGGISYYRLTQTDYDGTVEMFDVVAVERALRFNLSVSPNPVPLGEVAKLSYDFPDAKDDDHILVVVYDMNGKAIYANVEIVDMTKKGVIVLDPQNKLTPGIYSIQASSKNSLYQQKLVVR